MLINLNSSPEIVTAVIVDGEQVLRILLGLAGSVPSHKIPHVK